MKMKSLLITPALFSVCTALTVNANVAIKSFLNEDSIDVYDSAGQFVRAEPLNNLNKNPKITGYYPKLDLLEITDKQGNALLIDPMDVHLDGPVKSVTYKCDIAAIGRPASAAEEKGQLGFGNCGGAKNGQ